MSELETARLSIDVKSQVGVTVNALSAQRIDEIKLEVAATLDAYYTRFNERNMAALPEEIFHIPWILLDAKGPQTRLTKEQALQAFEAALKALLDNNWGKSVFTTESVCPLNEGAAIASGYNTRFKKDGSVMSVGGVTYTR